MAGAAVTREDVELDRMEQYTSRPRLREAVPRADGFWSLTHVVEVEPL